MFENMGLSKVNACTQKSDETPDDYVHRLQQVFNDHSGIDKPDDYPGNDMTPYESLLKQQFLNGLQPDATLAVRDSCIGHSESSVRLAEFIRHANHADKLTRRREKTRLTAHSCSCSTSPLNSKSHSRTPLRPHRAVGAVIIEVADVGQTNLVPATMAPTSASTVVAPVTGPKTAPI